MSRPHLIAATEAASEVTCVVNVQVVLEELRVAGVVEVVVDAEVGNVVHQVVVVDGVLVEGVVEGVEEVEEATTSDEDRLDVVVGVTEEGVAEEEIATKDEEMLNAASKLTPGEDDIVAGTPGIASKDVVPVLGPAAPEAKETSRSAVSPVGVMLCPPSTSCSRQMPRSSPARARWKVDAPAEAASVCSLSISPPPVLLDLERLRGDLDGLWEGEEEEATACTSGPGRTVAKGSL